jgi:hypothetical protein
MHRYRLFAMEGVQELSRTLRDVFVLAELEEMSTAEIARMLAIPSVVRARALPPSVTLERRDARIPRIRHQRNC